MKLKSLTVTALMAALVFAGTYYLKIPVPAMGGYIHLGDSMIFLTVLLLGKKEGAIAGAIGGALADLIGGFAIWVIPTFAIKIIMALIMGTVTEHVGKRLGHYSWTIGCVLGCIFQVLAYSVISGFLFGKASGLAMLPGCGTQSLGGFLAAAAAYSVLYKSGLMTSLKQQMKA